MGRHSWRVAGKSASTGFPARRANTAQAGESLHFCFAMCTFLPLTHAVNPPQKPNLSTGLSPWDGDRHTSLTLNERLATKSNSFLPVDNPALYSALSLNNNFHFRKRIITNNNFFQPKMKQRNSSSSQQHRLPLKVKHISPL